jgi:hypothetical protein
MSFFTPAPNPYRSLLLSHSSCKQSLKIEGVALIRSPHWDIDHNITGNRSPFRRLADGKVSPPDSPISLIPGTFYPKRWLLSSPCCPASKNFSLVSDTTLNLPVTRPVRESTNVPPPNRSIFPALNKLKVIFHGITEYLEDYDLHRRPSTECWKNLATRRACGKRVG